MSWFSIVITLIVGFIPGFLFGVYASAVVMTRTKMADFQVKNTIPFYFLEKEKGMCYLYDRATQNFVCQAPTLTKLAKEVYKRKISLAFILNKDGTEKFWFSNGKVKPAIMEKETNE